MPERVKTSDQWRAFFRLPLDMWRDSHNLRDRMVVAIGTLAVIAFVVAVAVGTVTRDDDGGGGNCSGGLALPDTPGYEECVMGLDDAGELPDIGEIE